MSSESYVTLVCNRCGDEYERHRSNAEQSKWCSMECQRGTLNGVQRVEKYTDEWYENRRKALQRDNHRCQNCGDKVGPQVDSETADAHVHHKTPVQRGGTHELDNLETLCAECHQNHHGENGV
jgi:5-methylcytosine-specific restriction endonuclease McrA